MQVNNSESTLLQSFRRICLLYSFVILFVCEAAAQKDTMRIYDPLADAGLQAADAVGRARQENKHVMLMIGGNWCRWCLMFEKFRLQNSRVDSAVASGYIWQHINYSKDNKNPELLQELGYPQRFGFPVFVVLDTAGRRLHTQNSSYLEEGEGYSEAKVLEFLRHWSPEALKPSNY